VEDKRVSCRKRRKVNQPDLGRGKFVKGMGPGKSTAEAQSGKAATKNRMVFQNCSSGHSSSVRFLVAALPEIVQEQTECHQAGKTLV
jgi:hypothetical protein